MARVLDHKTEGVTLGVLDKDLRLVAELQQVTFADVLGGLHTVFSHRNGPYRSVGDVIKAWEEGTLHTHESHRAAYDAAVLRGDTGTAERIKPLADTEGSHTSDAEDGE